MRHLSPVPPPVEAAYRAHERTLYGLAYRLTGSAADAADLVQEAFARLVERGPADLSRDVQPWLVRVVVNLGRDRYRRRKRHGYAGPWLPEPVDTEAAPWLVAPLDTEATYSTRESVRWAFLVALEALGPSERAVLLLCDVLDYSAREAGDVLGRSDASVRTLHLRARRKLAAYDAARVASTAETGERARAARADDSAQQAQLLATWSAALMAGDREALARLLADDVRARTAGGGVVRAARREVVGADAVARFFLGLQRKLGEVVPDVRVRQLNGQLALELRLTEARPGWAPRVVLALDAGADGRIDRVWITLAPPKLARLA
jgi:RNA polymerase sigma-70 factor (ECF subfamily)